MPSFSLRDQLARRVDAARERLIANTQRLVAVASPNPPSDTHDVAADAKALLLEIPDIEVERIEPAPRVVSLVGHIKGARPGAKFVTDHLRQFGAQEISRAAFHRRLEQALQGLGEFNRLPSDVSGAGILQLVSQTSNVGCSTA